MRSTLRHYGPVALLLAVILAVSAVLSLMTEEERDTRRRVLATTYPLYVAAQNILGDTDEVRLEMLSGTGAGCLHDYQLTPADRLAGDRAFCILTNGIGAEPFLQDAEREGKIVNTGLLVDLLCADRHEGEEHHDHAEYNEHIWVSPTRYKQQVENTSRVLYGLLHKQEVLDNAAAYVAAIDEVAQRLPDLSGRPCVLFHDSLSYLAADMGLDVKLTLSAEGESGIAAGDLATVERLAKEDPDLILLYDTQYPIRYTAVDGLVPADQVLALETAVVGTGKPTDWLEAMGRNAYKLQKLTQGGDAP